MRLQLNKTIIRWALIVSSFVIVSLILWNTNRFFQHFKTEERKKVKSWSVAQIDLIQSLDNLKEDLNPVTTYILTEMTSGIPMFVIDKNDELNTYNNIDSLDINSALKIEKLIQRFSSENNPIEVKIDTNLSQTIYYGNSALVNKLKYYPLALLLIILLFSGVVYFFYRSTKIAQQNKLWTGMAKETAHQIGTPLSSLVGWAELLKSEQVNPEYIGEIEKDIDRLKTITERFSKIGSVPELKPTNIAKETQKAIEYLQARTSKLITFIIDIPDTTITTHLNTHLYNWAIENLVKNAIDAMKGKGQLKVTLFEKDKRINIQISDTGKGISKSNFNKIFDPGFTTKKRGWGLGLSLTKRIIEDYHNGKIKILMSEIGKGTTIQISLHVLT